MQDRFDLLADLLNDARYAALAHPQNLQAPTGATPPPRTLPPDSVKTPPLPPVAAVTSWSPDPKKTDVAAEHPEIVAKLLQKAQVFDDAFQKQIPAVQYLSGPKPRAPGQVRKATENIDEWLKLTH